MKQNIIRKACPILQAVFMSGVLAACDAHIEVPDTAVRPGHVLCVDGKAVPYSEYENSGKQAIAVVFHTYSDGETEGNGYAVYLWDMAPKAFADSLGVEQGTSADITAYDGNANTNALHGTDETTSPMAESVFALWKYGQSAYVPSVAQIRLLYAASSIRSSRNAAETRFRLRPTSAGTGHRRRWKDSRRSKHGSTRQPAEPCRKRPRRRRIKCVPL